MSDSRIPLDEFIGALFPCGDDLIELRALPSRARTFVQRNDTASLRAFLRRAGNHYFGVAARASDRDGTAENLAELNALFVDIDVEKGADLEDLHAFVHPPSIIVNSGGGRHVYWLLDAPLPLRTPDERARAKSALRCLAFAVGGDLSAAEPVRILRVPGTTNLKYTPARAVTIEHFDITTKYSLKTIVSALPAEKATAPAASVAKNGRIPEGGRNAHLTSLAGSMRRRNMTPEAIRAALITENAARCNPPLDTAEVEAIAASVGRYAPEKPAEKTSRRVVLTAASSITIKPVKWLWDGRMALGSFGLVAGRESVGKTTVTTTLAAQITRGTLPGAYFGTPRPVAIAAAEDSWEHTIVPRLMAAGADLDLVYRVDVTTTSGIECALSLPLDLAELERVIREAGIVLVLLDPLLSRLDSALDSHKDAEVRKALEPLAQLAADTDCCIVGLIHVNKSASSDPLTTIMASRAFAAVARFVLFAMTDPDDDTRRLLGLAKNNLGRVDLPTLAYCIEGHCVATTDDGDVWTGRLEWLGESDRTIRDVIMTTTDTGDRTATSEAVDWLEDYLTLAGGSADSAEAKRAGAEAGHAGAAIRRARERLRLRTVNTNTKPRRTIWFLPEPQSCRARGGTLTTSTTSTTSTIPPPSGGDILGEGSCSRASRANGESPRARQHDWQHDHQPDLPPFDPRPFLDEDGRPARRPA